MEPTMDEKEQVEDHSSSVIPAASPFFVDESGSKASGGRLPQWLNHFNKKDLKTLFKCSVAVWIATLFVVINPTLHAYGQATFFGCILLFMVPCNGIVFINLMGGLTILMGMVLAWAWGAITMKAALSTRSATETNARLEQLSTQASQYQSNTEQATGQSMYTKILIYEGFMLDTRISITYFCMIGLFIYMVARVRVAAPKLTLLSMFAIIVSDVFLTIGPLLPSFSGLIPTVLIKPAATAVGIGVACNLLIFPQSTSYLVLDNMKETLAPMKGFLDACKISFKHSSANFNLDSIQNIKAEVTGCYKGLEASMGFLALDVSMGRWNIEDVKSLQEPLRQLVIMFLGLLQLQITRTESRTRHKGLQTLDEAIHGGPSEVKMPSVGQNHIVQILNLRERFKHPDAGDLLERSMEALFTSSELLLDSCGEALDAIVEALQIVNGRRWTKQPKEDENLQICANHKSTLDNLRRNQRNFVELTSQHLLDPHNHLFNDKGQLKLGETTGAPLSGLMIGLIFEERILGVGSALDVMLTRIIQLEEQRTKAKIWFPTGLRNLFSWAVSKDAALGATAGPEESDGQDFKKIASNDRTRSKKIRREQKDKGKTGAKAELEMLHFHGGHKRSVTGKMLLAITQWFSSTEGLYALRVLIVTIAMGVPAVITSSAGFFYREKGLWALIMAQTGLVTYTADFVFGFCLRVIGTIIGGVLGMVCWYVGAGHGPGNSYGMATIMAVAIVPLMWGRLFGPPALLQGVLLTVATTYLVVAYSWVDTHIPAYGNPGVGYSVFWRRVLLVIIGFTASAIVIFVPRPPSASRHYRKVLSNTIASSKDLYALYVASWIHHYPDLKETSEKQVLITTETLGSIAGPIALLRFEFSSSNFNAETLTHIMTICSTINQSLIQLLVYTPLLTEVFKNRFARRTGAFDERIIGDLMAVLTLVEQSLKTGDPLPAILPVPLVARCTGLSRAFAEDESGHVDLSRDAIKEDGFRRYCVVMSAFVQLLGAADELVWRVKSAVGETSYVDLEQPFLTRV